MLLTKSLQRKLWIGVALAAASAAVAGGSSVIGLRSYHRMVDDLSLSITDLPRRSDLAAAIARLAPVATMEIPDDSHPLEFRQAFADRQYEDFQRVFTGEPTGENATMKDLDLKEMLTLVPLLGLSLFLGVYPKPVLERLEPSVKALIVHVEQHSDWCESDHRAADGTCVPGDRFTSEAANAGGEGG